MKKRIFVVLAAVLLLSLLSCGASAKASWGVSGDVSGDFAVNVTDAVQLYYHVNGKMALTDEALANAGFVSDSVSIADAAQLYYFVNGKATDVAADKLLSPDTVQCDTLPVGEAVDYTVVADGGEAGGDIFDKNGLKTYVYLVRSLEELRALYEHDEFATFDYTEGYTEDYFEDGALAIVRTYVRDLPRDIRVKSVVKKDGELAVTLCRYYGFGREFPKCRHTFVLEMTATDLADVTETAAYVYETVLYPVTNADEKPTGDNVAFTAVASRQAMGSTYSTDKVTLIRSAEYLAVARELLTDEQYAAYDAEYFEEKVLLLVSVNYPDCAGEVYVDSLVKNGMELGICYIHESNGTSLPAHSDRVMLLELDADDAGIVSFTIFGEKVYVPR